MKKTVHKMTALIAAILALTAVFHLLARAEGPNTIYMPLLARSSTCTVPSAAYASIQSAIDDHCDFINLTAAVYLENLLIQDHTVTITGQSPANTSINGNATGSVIRIEDNAQLTLQNVTITNGQSTIGGGIFNRGTTRIANTVIKNNSVQSGTGGGISSRGILTVDSSWIIDNDATPFSTASVGGGVFIRGTAHFTDTVISGNIANTGGGLGVEGFNNDTVVTLVNSQITNNEADWGGGIITNKDASVTINGSLINDNQVKVAGGGILNGGTMLIFNSQIIRNTAGMQPYTAACGGGILNSGKWYSSDDEGRLVIDSTEIRENVSLRHGGGVCNEGLTGEVEIYNSLFVLNTAAIMSGSEGGGFYSRSNIVAIIENTTFSNNQAAANGGAISAYNLHLVNVTINKNSAPAGSGIYSWAGIQMVNTIITGNFDGLNCETEPGADLTSLGHNIDSDNSCDLTAPGDMPSTNPLLGPLQDNGGPTHTLGLLFDSPAIDNADNPSCPLTDQRGVPRPQGPACDIGAYEYDG